MRSMRPPGIHADPNRAANGKASQQFPAGLASRAFANERARVSAPVYLIFVANAYLVETHGDGFRGRRLHIALNGGFFAERSGQLNQRPIDIAKTEETDEKRPCHALALFQD